MTTATVLTRDVGLETLTSPNGRSFDVQPWKVNPGLLEIVYKDSKGGVVPEALQGRFTSQKEAMRHLMKFLKEFWDLSDEQAKKARKTA